MIPFMTTLHWLVIAIFILLFFILVLLSLKEKNIKTLISMIFSSFLLISAGMVFSLYALDKYTKKGKLVTCTQTRDLMKESVIVRGKVKNIGKFKIGYCKIEVRISNDLTSSSSKKRSYFTPNKSLGNIFGSKDIKSNIVKEEFLAVTDLYPNKSKNFIINMRFPPHFVNPKYRVKLFCH